MFLYPQQWFTSNFDDNSSSKSETTLKKEKSETNLKRQKSGSKRKVCDSDEEDIEAISSQDRAKEKFQSIDWLKTFQPKEVSDLALHPKKLEDLRNWFKLSCTKAPNKILLLEGPTGCGKATSLRLVAKENGWDISEWINATDVESALFYENSENFNREFVSYENQITKFSDFLLRTSRVRSIFSDRPRLLMVKDFPNTFLRKNEEFWNTLKCYASEGMAPLVFVVTETNSKSLNIAFNLFPDKIRVELGIDVITFNAVSTTLMKRGVKRIVQLVESNINYKAHFKRPADGVMDNIIEQCQGDIRNAILNLSFASTQSDFKPLVAKVTKVKKGVKKAKATRESDGLGKNEVLSLMHGLGRVFYPKLEINDATKLLELTHKPETLTESFSSQPSNFIRMVHSNYIKNFSNIADVSKAADMLSLSDCFESEYRDDRFSDLNLNLVIRSAMVLNTTPASGFRTISAYANKKWKNTEQTNKDRFIKASKALNNGNIITRNDFFCDYNSYLSLIQK